MPAASTINPEERKFVADFGASMQSRIGDHEGKEKSDVGDDSQRRRASKRRDGKRP